MQGGSYWEHMSAEVYRHLTIPQLTFVTDDSNLEPLARVNGFNWTPGNRSPG
jgi:hypothetical protein